MAHPQTSMKSSGIALSRNFTLFDTQPTFQIRFVQFVFTLA